MNDELKKGYKQTENYSINQKRLLVRIAKSPLYTMAG